MSLLIITSTFNRPTGVLATALSVRDFMQGADYTHVVVNDAGVEVDTVLDGVGSSNLVIKNNTKNLGKNRTVNEIVKQYGASHNYFLSLDDDDVLLPEVKRVDFSLNHYSTIVTPKRLDGVSQCFSRADNLRGVEFTSALNLVDAVQHRELAFAVNTSLYLAEQANLRDHISRSGPELCIYDIISRSGFRQNLYFDLPIMDCAYQTDGMTTNFRRRLKEQPEDFESYYHYLMENSPNLQQRIKSAFRLIQVMFYKMIKAQNQ